MSKSKYLIAVYTKVPRDKSRTHIKGFWDNEANYRFDEQITFATRLKNKDIETGHVILDMLNSKVIKNRSGDRPFDDLFAYFHKTYSNEMDNFLGIYPDTIKR